MLNLALKFLFYGRPEGFERLFKIKVYFCCEIFKRRLAFKREYSFDSGATI